MERPHVISDDEVIPFLVGTRSFNPQSVTHLLVDVIDGRREKKETKSYTAQRTLTHTYI